MRREVSVMTSRLSATLLGFVCLVATRGTAQQADCRAPASTYDLIQRGIFEQHGCTQAFCHGAAERGGLDLRAAFSYDSLVHDQSDEVVPGGPDQSLLYLKLAAKTLGTKGVPGQPMPVSALALSPDELEGIRLWILGGAPRSGSVASVADLIAVCPQSTPLATAAVPPPCGMNEPDLLLPNLVEDPPSEISVRLNRGHRWIEFTSGVANEGDGPLIVRAAATPTQAGQVLDAVQIILRADGTQCSRPAGTIQFEGNGGHWAYGNFAHYELRKDDPVTGDVVAQSSKSAYCLLDTNPLLNSANLQHQFDAHCEDNVGVMGISVGFKDVYDRVYPNQWIDLDGDPTISIRPGTYYLVNTANPNSTLLETAPGAQDNVAYTRVTVRLPDPNDPIHSRVAVAQHHVAHPHAPAHAPSVPHTPHAPAHTVAAHTHVPGHGQPSAPHAPHTPHRPHLAMTE
jgi:lysyl oxidase